MSDEFELIDDDEQTIEIDDDELAVEEEDDLAVSDDDLDDDLDDDDDFEDDEDEDDDLPAPDYASPSTVYTLFLLISCMAYVGAIAITLMELKDYCLPDKFFFGLFGGS